MSLLLKEQICSAVFGHTAQFCLTSEGDVINAVVIQGSYSVLVLQACLFLYSSACLPFVKNATYYSSMFDNKLAGRIVTL